MKDKNMLVELNIDLWENDILPIPATAKKKLLKG